MKVFLSWSGDTSQKLAIIFREWIPNVLQFVKPYVSSEDIDKGIRWSIDIASELETTNYGIVFVTPTNMDAPWIHFEAGALSKAIGKSNVSPFLFGLNPTDLNGKLPLVQFQSTKNEKLDIYKLIESINENSSEPLEKSRLVVIFEKWWPDLQSNLNLITTEAAIPVDIQTNDSNPKVDEILDAVRSQLKISTQLHDQINQFIMPTVHISGSKFLHKKISELILKHQETNLVPIEEVKALVQFSDEDQIIQYVGKEFVKVDNIFYNRRQFNVKFKNDD